jgi:hypothetical protein
MLNIIFFERLKIAILLDETNCKIGYVLLE